MVAWGDNGVGQLAIPTGLSNVTNVVSGFSHTVALKSDGTVEAWGWNLEGQTTIPSGLTSVTAITAAWDYSVALKVDGTVVQWGSSSNIPKGLDGVTAIAAGSHHTVALKRSGTVEAWGRSSYGQTDVPSTLNGVTAIAAQTDYTLVLKNNDTLIQYGSDPASIPTGLSSVTAISAGSTSRTTWCRIPQRLDNPVIIADQVIAVDSAILTPKITTKNGRSPTKTTYNGSFNPPSSAGKYTVFSEADYLDSYGSATGTLIIANGQTISFPAIGTQIYGVAPLTLASTASSSLPVIYSVISGPATVSGNTLTITGAGTVVVAANQTGNDNYVAAPQVTQTITVQKAAQTINFPAIGNQTVNVNPYTLSASAATADLIVSFSVISGPANVTGNKLTFTGEGTVIVAANQAGNANYLPAEEVRQSIVVTKTSDPNPPATGTTGSSGSSGGCGLGGGVALMLAFG